MSRGMRSLARPKIPIRLTASDRFWDGMLRKRSKTIWLYAPAETRAESFRIAMMWHYAPHSQAALLLPPRSDDQELRE